MRDDLNQNPQRFGGQVGISQERDGGKPACLRFKDNTSQPEKQAVDLSEVKTSDLTGELIARLEAERLQVLKALRVLEGGQDG